MLTPWKPKDAATRDKELSVDDTAVKATSPPESEPTATKNPKFRFSGNEVTRGLPTKLPKQAARLITSTFVSERTASRRPQPRRDVSLATSTQKPSAVQ